MDLRQLVIASLAATCTSCNPFQFIPEEFDVDTVLDAETVANEVGLRDRDTGELDCNRACYAAVRQLRGHSRFLDHVESCEVEPAPNDGVYVRCQGKDSPRREGRRPLAELAWPDANANSNADALGCTLAELAYLEAASILAFVELGRQLERFGAPRELIERCASAAADERRHAAALSELAAELGVATPTPTTIERQPPTLVELALHNAVEGCVHESFAALLAVVRSVSAGDPRLRRTYREIAEDELGHGQLAWDIHAWVIERLDPIERARVLDARARAFAELPERAGALADLPWILQPLTPADTTRLAREFCLRAA